MSTLTELFDQHRDELLQRIRIDEGSPAHVVQEVKSWLGSLLVLTVREKERSLNERRLAGFLLDIVAMSVTTLVSCHVVAGTKSPPSRSSSFRQRGEGLLRVVRLLVAVALAGALYQSENFFGLTLVAVLVLLDVQLWFGKTGETVVPTTSPEAPATMRIDINAFLSRLRETLKAVDTVLVEVAHAPQPVTSSLGDDPAFLELFQELLYAASVDDGIFALKQLKPLVFLLEKHGIRVERFTAERAFLFDAVPSLDAKSREWLTLKPALVSKEGRTLRRGLATEPAFKEKGH